MADDIKQTRAQLIEQTLAEVLAAQRCADVHPGYQNIAPARVDNPCHACRSWGAHVAAAQAAAIAHLLPVGTTTTEWGVRRQFRDWPESVETQYTGHDGWTSGKYDRAEVLRLSRSGGQYRGAVARDRTSYADHVTDWRPVEDGDA